MTPLRLNLPARLTSRGEGPSLLEYAVLFLAIVAGVLTLMR